MTITLEDVVNNFLLPVFGDESPFDIILSEEDLVVEDKLFGHFGGRAASPGGKSARMGRWVMTLSHEKNKEMRWAGFLAFWLSKFFFSEFPVFLFSTSDQVGSRYPISFSPSIFGTCLFLIGPASWR